jgi:hypothetical protein
MLKVTILTMSHSSHAETFVLYIPWLKLTIWTMTRSSLAETDNFDHNIFQTC